MRLRDRLKRLPGDIATELDRAAESLVPYVDRVLNGLKSTVRQGKTEVQPREQLYRDLGQRTFELLMAGDDRLRSDARVLELLAALTRREAEARDLAAQQAAAKRDLSPS